MKSAQYVYVVHFRCEGKTERGVFFASDEETALRFCLHYTGPYKFSQSAQWELSVHRELMNDMDRRVSVCVAIFDQDGYLLPIPDLSPEEFGVAIRRILQRLTESGEMDEAA